MDDIGSRIIELVAKSKNLPTTQVNMESTFDELQIDSLDKINLHNQANRALSANDCSLHTLEGPRLDANTFSRAQVRIRLRLARIQ